MPAECTILHVRVSTENPNFAAIVYRRHVNSFGCELVRNGEVYKSKQYRTESEAYDYARGNIGEYSFREGRVICGLLTYYYIEYRLDFNENNMPGEPVGGQDAHFIHLKPLLRELRKIGVFLEGRDSNVAEGVRGNFMMRHVGRDRCKVFVGDNIETIAKAAHDHWIGARQISYEIM